MQTAHRFRELLDRYLAGTCTPQEKALMEEWFEKGGDIDKADLQLSADDQLRLLANMHRLQGHVPRRHKILQILFDRRIAAVLVGLLIALGIWIIGNKAAPMQMTVVTTTTGEIKQVVLPDSSMVLLNANSTLQYHADFKTRRQLQLSGEALFTVTRDENHPFAVQTGDSLVTTVLGTQFNINSYMKGEDINISVISGKVLVSRSGSMLDTLGKAQAIHYNKAAKDFTIHSGVSTASLTNWANGEWEYENVRFSDLFVLLQNHYGVTLTANRDPRKLQTGVSVNFNKRQSAREIADVFCSFAGCRYRMKNATEIEIY